MYRGIINSYGRKFIFHNQKSIPFRFDLANHSPDGFEWGYMGSGPSQAALAILAHYYNDDKVALDRYQQFKYNIISNFDRTKVFELTEKTIREWEKEVYVNA